MKVYLVKKLVSITFFNLLLIAGVIQGFVFNIVTLFYKKKFSKVIVFLNLTVLFLSLNNLQAWLIDNGYSSNLFFIKQLLVPWYLLIFPMFYGFLINYLKADKKELRTLLRFSIFLFSVELLIRILLIINAYSSSPDLDDSVIKLYTSFEEMFNAAFGFFVVFRSGYLVFMQKSKYQYILKYDDIKWIKIFLVLGSVIILFWISAIVIYNIYNNNSAYYPLRLGTSILLYWIGYQGFYRYNIVNDRILLRNSLSSNQFQSNLSSESNQIVVQTKENDYSKYKDEFDTIHDYILNEQRYLDSQLSLEKLAQEQQMSVSHLSKVINTCSDYNFSDYINALRIEQAKKLFSDSNFDKYTNVAIGLECGFNSKSTFYSAFKKFTSLTPTEYRKIN